MDLKEFISESLKQVVDGVIEAQEYGRPKGATIVPLMTRMGDSKGSFYAAGGRRQHHNIEFNIAVTASETTGQEGKAGLKIPYLEFGGKLTAEQESDTVSHIRFELPVLLPIQK